MPRPQSRVRPVAGALAAAALIMVLGGCAKMDSALGKQWIVVSFSPDTTIATARQVTSACSHVPNLPLEGPVKPTTAQTDMVDSVNYDATNASDADMARLQVCLQRFPSVQGFTLTEPGDSG